MPKKGYIKKVRLIGRLPGSSDNGTNRTKQHIKKWVIDFGTLPTVLNDAEMYFDVADNHVDAPKKSA